MDTVSNLHLHRNLKARTQELPENRHYIPKDYLEAAENQERVFAKFMLNEFYKTIPKEKADSTAQQIYQGWNIDEQAKIMTESANGLGLKDLILDRLYPRERRTKQNLELYNQQKEAQVNRILEYRRRTLAAKKHQQPQNVSHLKHIDVQGSINKFKEIQKGEMNKNEVHIGPRKQSNQPYKNITINNGTNFENIKMGPGKAQVSKEDTDRSQQ